MKESHVNVKLTTMEAYALWRSGKNPQSLDTEDVLLAMSARKKIAKAMRGNG